MADDPYYWCTDVSNYQGDITEHILAHQPQRIIIRASDEDATKRQIAVDQCRTAWSMGVGVDMYSWPYPGDDPIQKVHYALAIAADAGLPGLGMLMPDFEEGTLERLGPDGLCDWCDAFGNECVRIGLPMVVYTRRTFWQDYVGNTSRCNQWYLLACQPDEVPTLGSVTPFGGWTHANGMIVGKQWSFAGNTDRDIILRSVYAVEPPHVEPSPPDPCAALRAGLRQIVDAKPYRAPRRAQLQALLDA